jgi:hypothetical protein
MRRLDETPIDPEIADGLAALDAALGGEPVDPAHAELAELALLVAAERPAPDRSFSTALDERVGRRFARAPATASPRRPRRRWVWAPAAGLAAAVAVAVVIVAGGGGGHAAPLRAASAPNQALKAPEAASAGSSAGSSAARQLSARATVPSPPQLGPALQLPPNGRKLVQAAQLSLSTSPGHVDTVAQEIFDVVGQAKGVVDNSSVTAGGSGGYAQFQLSIPSGSLPQAMAALSAVRYARVASRTDTTQDVNDRYAADVRQLADARALRTALLKQLANATTQAQIDSLTARIHDTDASISSDEATLRRLNRQVDYSQVTLTVNAGTAPVPVTHGGGGFTLGKAARDAGRVLTVAAGVALIAAAALVPLVLFGALGLWIAAAVRRRRREQALDAV